MERLIPGARRVEQNWENPILVRWAENVRNAIDEADGPVWLIAHSFGCLAAVVAASDRVNKTAGVMLVAPANPERFNLGGIRHTEKTEDFSAKYSVTDVLPRKNLIFPSMVVASTNDTWMSYSKARFWSDCWGSHLITLDNAGHINVASGFGPWPQGLQIFRDFQDAFPSKQSPDLQHEIASRIASRGRAGHVSRIRHYTRRYFGF